jgi:DNA repair photolyase
MQNSDFFGNIFVKINAPQILKKEFNSSRWKGKAVNIGGVTDSYQICEKKYRLMPDILKEFIKHKNPAIISTKSSLILDDIDLITELSQVADIRIGTSITCSDDSFSRKIEPGASITSDRFEIIRRFSERGVNTSVLLMPIIPFVNDSYQNLEEIFKRSKENGALSIICGSLNLRGNNYSMFFNRLKKIFPEKIGKIQKIYNEKSYCSKEYSLYLFEILTNLRKKYDFSSRVVPIKDKKEIQLSLF